MKNIKKVYIDVMVKGRFYCQLPYQIKNGGEVSIKTLQRYAKRKRPALKYEKINTILTDKRI